MWTRCKAPRPLERLGTQRYHVLVSDLGLPETDGSTSMRELPLGARPRDPRACSSGPASTR